MNTDDNIKFPEHISVTVLNDKTYISKNGDEIDKWFQRCMNDFPYVKNYGETVEEIDFMKLSLDRTKWFGKWFSQFRGRRG